MRTKKTQGEPQPIASHLSTFPGLYLRVGEVIVEAPEADQAVARSYPTWPDKGTIRGGRRLTLLSSSTRLAPDQELRIIHVAEAVEPSAVLYTMGPKAILGEYLDGQLASPAPPDEDDALRPPGLYDGPVVAGPAVDYGYAISSYRFPRRGQHRIFWRLGDVHSNELVISVE